MSGSLLKLLPLGVALTLLYACGGTGRDCCVNPDPPPPSVRTVTVSPSVVSLRVGESRALVAQVDVVNGAGTGVTWSSDNPAIVSISATGVVTGVSSGGGVVRATSTYSTSVSGTAVVTVNTSAEPASIAISPRQVRLNPGVSLALSATVTGGSGSGGGGGGGGAEVTWRSANPSVASIGTSGIVSAQAPGSSLITALLSADSTVRDSVTVFVDQRLATSWSSARLSGDLYDEVVSIAPINSSLAFVIDGSGNIVRWDGTAWHASASGSTYNTVFSAVHGSSSDNVIAVGSNGVALRWNGSSWTSLSTGSTSQLYGVWVESVSSAWAVGASGTVLHWNGNTWSTEDAGTSVSLADVWAGDGVVYAVGAEGEVRLRSNNVWSKVQLNSQDIFYAVHGNNSRDVVIGGSFGALFRWNGGSWTSLSSAAVPGTIYTITGSSANGGRRYLAGDDGLSMLDETGELSLVETPYAPRLYGVGMDANGTVWTSGQRGLVMRGTSQQWSTLNIAPDLLDVWTADSKVAWAVGEFGSIYRWDGTTWIRQVTPTTSTLDAVWSTADRDAFAAGEGGVMLRWNGVTWNLMKFPSSAAVFSLWGSDGDNVYAVTSAGEIIHWDGQSWTIVSVTSGSLWSVFGYSPTSIYASGEYGTVLRLSNSTWAPMPVSAGGTLAGLWTYGSTGVYVVGANASGTAGVAYSWNGSSWASIDIGVQPVLTSLWGPGPFDLYATGDQGTMMYFNGNTIQTLPTGTTDLLWSVSGAPDASGGAFAVGYNSTIAAGTGSQPSARSHSAALQTPHSNFSRISLEPARGTPALRKPLPSGEQRKHRKQRQF